jgi:hypothetical protein
MTYSALEQQAPLDAKAKRDPDFAKRNKMKKFLDTPIPEFSVQPGGATSIDVTKPGIDKATGSGRFETSSGSPSTKGIPLACRLTSASPSEVTLLEREIEVICPHRSNRKKPKTQDGWKLRR